MNIHSIINNNTTTSIILLVRRNISMNEQLQKKILKLLGEKMVITSSELAKFLGVSWNTAEKYLLELTIENKIVRIKKVGVNLWMLK